MSNDSFSEDETVKVWVFVLDKLLGWPEERTLEWASQYKEDIETFNSWFYHQNTMSFVAHIFVPKSWHEAHHGMVGSKIEEQIGLLIEHTQDVYYNDDRYDWDLLRSQITELLHKHGISFDDIAEGTTGGKSS